MSINTMSSAPETKNTADQKEMQYQEQIQNLNEKIRQLEEQLALQSTKHSCDNLKGTVIQSRNMRTHNVDANDVNQGKLYRWGNNIINQQDVINTVNQLKEPFNTEVSNFIKAKNILGLQKYLNQNLAQGKIDKQQLANSLKAKGIRFNGQILEDGKFGPQTLETIRFIAQESKEGKNPPQKPQLPEQKEKIKSSVDWIPTAIMQVIHDIKNTNKNLNWSHERNSGGEILEGKNFHVDTARKTVELSTWGTRVNSFCGDNDSGNRCEYNRETGRMYTYLGHYRYEIPVWLPKLKLNAQGLPDENYINNREIIKLFADLGNVLNRTKNKAVLQKKGALEYHKGGIEVNDGVLGIKDISEIGGDHLDRLEKSYGHICRLGKKERVRIASLLTAAKLDIGKISRFSDIETPKGSIFANPLDDDHRYRVKQYSHTRKNKTRS